MRKIICIVTVCFMIVSVLSGCSVLQKLGFGKTNDELHPASSILIGEEEAKKLSDQVPVHLYFATEDNTKLKLEVRYIPMTEAKKSTSNLATKIVEELIRGPQQAGLKSTIPAGAKLSAPVSVDTASSTATVNFTKEFVDKHPGGETGAKLTIYSVVNSLTELKEVQKVKFLINGKQQADFKGSFQFNVPFPRSASLISKVVSPADSAIPASGKSIDKQGTSKQQSTVKATPTPTPKPSGIKATPTPTPKPSNTKATPTPAAKSSSGSTTNNSAAVQSSLEEEEAEATYLEILE